MPDECVPQPAPVAIVPTTEAESVIRERGGLLFIRPKVHRGLMGGVTLLRASTDVPEDALDYLRFRVGRILVFLSPPHAALPVAAGPRRPGPPEARQGLLGRMRVRDLTDAGRPLPADARAPTRA
ncbi:MAG: hypothetical protein ACJ77A_05470 [Actinomycetota bacterium]